MNIVAKIRPEIRRGLDRLAREHKVTPQQLAGEAVERYVMDSARLRRDSVPNTPLSETVIAFMDAGGGRG